MNTALIELEILEAKLALFGGDGSGNWGHLGRPGEVGGSGEGGLSHVVAPAHADDFHSAISAANENSKYKGFVTVHPKESYSKMRVFMNKEKTAGYALTQDKEIASLFNKSGKPGLGRQMLQEAIKNGGNHLYAFDGFLSKYYGDQGFTEVERYKFDDAQAPAGWNYSHFERPDVILMRYSGDSHDRQIKTHQSKTWGGEPGSFPRGEEASRGVREDCGRGTRSFRTLHVGPEVNPKKFSNVLKHIRLLQGKPLWDTDPIEELVQEIREFGGDGSGNWGHLGRPGLVGGSGEGGSIAGIVPPGDSSSGGQGPHEQMAVVVHAQAKLREPKITHTLKSIAEKHGGKLEGLDFKLKAPDSIARKLSVYMDNNPGSSLEDAVKGTYDLNRYTFLFNNDDNFTKNVLNAQEDLKKSGYKPYDTRQRNYIVGRGPYRGFNTVVQDASGNKIEVQYHTPESYKIKTENHPLYRSIEAEKDPVRKNSLYEQMVSRWSDFRIPKDAHLLGVPMQ